MMFFFNNDQQNKSNVRAGLQTLTNGK